METVTMYTIEVLKENVWSPTDFIFPTMTEAQLFAFEQFPWPLKTRVSPKAVNVEKRAEPR